MTVWNSAEHQLIREYELENPLPRIFGNVIKPPIIITPTLRGYFMGARLNDNGLYNIYLDTGDVLRNVDLNLNMKIQDVLALLSGFGTVFVNKTMDGFEVPWDEIGESNLGIVEAQRNMYRNRYESFKDMLMVKPNSTEEALRIEQKHEEVGRASRKGMGHPMIWGKREAQERMSPEVEEIMNQFEGGGGGMGGGAF